MCDFISEDDLETFEGWLKYQGFAPTTPKEESEMRRVFEEGRKQRAPKVGLMKLKPVPGAHRYAVAVKDGSDLWLTLWVLRSPRGEFFVMMPRGDREWDPHMSYHLDGTLHMKSRDHKVVPPQKRQPLTGAFHGSEHLGSYYGHGPKTVGAICDPAAFFGVVEVAPGVLGPRHGGVTVDLVEPDHEPTGFPWTRSVVRKTFRDILPWVVITVGVGPD